MIDPQKIKNDFPILKRTVNGKPLVYLDNAATTQKPQVVIDALRNFYETMNSNVHRGVHALSEEATEAYENTRKKVAEFIGADDVEEIIFTRGTTEAVNLLAYSWGEENISDGDEIVVTILEHHSNLVPWQQLCLRKNAVLKYIPIREDGMLDLSGLTEIITKKTKLVAVTQMSNTLGTIVPLEKIIAAAKDVGAKVLVDGAQGIGHLKTDVRAMDCDFFAFSAHKMLGPTGVGVLYGKRELLEKMAPFQFGGDMIKEVHEQSSTWNDLPYKFEAGTPNIADTIALVGAIEYLEGIGMENVIEHDRKLKKYAVQKLSELPGIKMYGPMDEKESGGILSFNIPGVHAHDVGSILNEDGIAIRTGHHCTQPLMERLGVPATARMSFYIYNSEEDIDIAVAALKKVYEVFKIT